MAAEAASQRLVDKAEVLLYKLQSGRVRLEEVDQRRGPLWAMADALREAEASQDSETMKKAIEGWAEDKPDSKNPAFEREDSPTKAFRAAHGRIRELRLNEARKELQICVDSLTKQTPASREQRDPQALRHVVKLVRELVGLGWDMTSRARARLLTLLTIVGAGVSDSGASRFGASTLTSIADSARIVFLLDQSKSMRSDVFNRFLKPAVAQIADAIEKRKKGIVMGAVAYGPVKKVQELTPELIVFKAAVSQHVFADGKDAPLAKALRKGLELFKQESSQAPESERDSVRIVFNFISREPVQPEAQNAFHMLDAQNCIVVSIVLGPSVSEDAVQECSSPGQVFKVADASGLHQFVEDAFTGMEDVLSKAEKLTPEETLQRLEEACS